MLSRLFFNPRLFNGWKYNFNNNFQPIIQYGGKSTTSFTEFFKLLSSKHVNSTYDV